MRFKPWLLLQEANQHEIQALKILGQNQQTLEKLKSFAGEAKFLPALALLHREQPDLGQLQRDWAEYLNLMKDKRMPVLSVQGDRLVILPANQPIDHLQWSEKIHALIGDRNLVQRRMQIDHSEHKPPIFKNDELEIYETDGPGDCIRYGKGYKFCISRPGNTMWQSYRDTRISTFYFVYDKKKSDTDPLHIVVVDMTENGPILTDADNRTGNIAEYGKDADAYLNHLHKRGVPKDIFKNRPLNKAEREEHELLGKSKHNLDWFKNLSPEHKSKYIGRGHELTDEQFNHIFDNGLDSLVKQYAEIGRKLNEHQRSKIMSKGDYRSKYLHTRSIADQQSKDLELDEYQMMRPEDANSISMESRARIAGSLGDIEYLKSIMEKGLNMGMWSHFNAELIFDGSTPDQQFIQSFSALEGAARHGNIETLQFLTNLADLSIGTSFEKTWNGSAGPKSGAYFNKNLGIVMKKAVEGDHLEAVEWIIGQMTEGHHMEHQAFILAANKGSEKVFNKYLHHNSEDHHTMGQSLKDASGNGSLPIVKTLCDTMFPINKDSGTRTPEVEKYLHWLGEARLNACINNRYEVARYLLEDINLPTQDHSLIGMILVNSNSLGAGLSWLTQSSSVSTYFQAQKDIPLKTRDIRLLKLLVERMEGNPRRKDTLENALYAVKENTKAAAYLVLQGASSSGPNLEKILFNKLGIRQDATPEEKTRILRKAAGLD